MHMNASKKPIGKCSGCPLNLKRSCAVYASPREQWSHGHKRCKGFMNEALYQHWLEEQMKEPAPKSRKEIRREKMLERNADEHLDGIPSPAGSRW